MYWVWFASGLNTVLISLLYILTVFKINIYISLIWEDGLDI